MKLIAPDRGNISFDTMINEMKEYTSIRPNAKIIVGSDSQKVKNKFCFATCVAIWDPGHGGIFYIEKDYKNPHRKFNSIKSMIAWKTYEEAGCTSQMICALTDAGIDYK